MSEYRQFEKEKKFENLSIVIIYSGKEHAHPCNIRNISIVPSNLHQVYVFVEFPKQTLYSINEGKFQFTCLQDISYPFILTSL